LTHLTRLARWGGIAAILGGVLEVVVVFFVPTPGPPSLTGGDPLPYRMVILLGVAGSPFLAAGIVALYARVAVHPGSPRAATGLAVAGAVLAAVAALVSLAAALQALTLGQILVPPEDSSSACSTRRSSGACPSLPRSSARRTLVRGAGPLGSVSTRPRRAHAGRDAVRDPRPALGGARLRAVVGSGSRRPPSRGPEGRRRAKNSQLLPPEWPSLVRSSGASCTILRP
jgi:hypothetical protein